MRHGDVWTITHAGGRWTVAVVSGDAFNARPAALPYVVPIVRRRTAGELPPYVAELADPDPVGGIAVVAELGQVDPNRATESLGMLTGASMARIAREIRLLFELH